MVSGTTEDDPEARTRTRRESGGTSRPDPERPPGGSSAAARERLRRLLADRRPRRVEDRAIERRAAVLLLLRPGGEGIAGEVAGEPPVPASAEGQAPERARGPGEEGPVRPAARFAARPPLAPDLAALEALFVLRAERDGDPWSGHVGLPGGHREEADRDLADAARRELAEETGLALSPEAVLGRLDDVHPRSRRLPSVAVTPYVGWTQETAGIRHGPEVDGHLWVPLAELEAPGRRSVLTFRRAGALRAFPAVEVGGLTIWGLTFAIVRRFLEELPRGSGHG